MNSKKAFTMAEALMRITIAAVLLFIVFKFGKGVADSLSGGNDALNSFESLANEMNSHENWIEKQTLLSLDSDTAVFGFSKTGNFECYGCGNLDKGKLRSFFTRPQNEECKDSACVCLCSSPSVPPDSPLSESLEIKCKKMSCRKTNYEISSGYEVKRFFKSISASDTASWKNGFVYARDIEDNTVPITGMPRNKERITSLFLERKTANGINYIGVCPVKPCIEQN
ncbi:MAG: hypothetical protein AABX00_03970 [Nanoarchaeota archaeon]